MDWCVQFCSFRGSVWYRSGFRKLSKGVPNIRDPNRHHPWQDSVSKDNPLKNNSLGLAPIVLEECIEQTTLLRSLLARFCTETFQEDCGALLLCMNLTVCVISFGKFPLQVTLSSFELGHLLEPIPTVSSCPGSFRWLGATLMKL